MSDIPDILDLAEIFELIFFFADPKSPRRSCHVSFKRMFAGLMSRCTIFSLLRNARMLII